MYKEDLALNNQQWLVCHKTKPNQTKIKQTNDLHIFVLFQGFLSNSNNL